MLRFPILIFDLDGTLIDSFPGIQLGLNMALADHGLDPVDLDWVYAHVGWGTRPLVTAAIDNGVTADELLATFMRRYQEVVLDHSPPFPGADAALRRLAKDHTLAVASNKPLVWVEGLVARHGWTELMAVVAGPETVGAHKPNPLMIDFILSSTNHSKTDGLLIGDMPVDVETGLNAGIPVVGVTTGSSSREVLMAAGCTAVLKSVADLVDPSFRV